MTREGGKGTLVGYGGAMYLRSALAVALAFATLSAAHVGGASANPVPANEVAASEASVKAWLLSTGGDGPLDYALSWVDLNGDGQTEAIVYLSGPGVCGTGGCRMYILERQRSDFLVRARTTVTRGPAHCARSGKAGAEPKDSSPAAARAHRKCQQWVATCRPRISGNQTLGPRPPDVW